MAKECPRWMRRLIHSLAREVDAEYPDVSLGWCYRYRPKAKCPWRLAVFPTRLEVREAGPDDGRTFRTGFGLCITALSELFDDAPHIDWVAPARYHGELDGPHMIFRGMYRGHRLTLQVFDRAPRSYPTVTIFDTATGTCKPHVQDQTDG